MAGHWYDRTGETRYEIKNQSSKTGAMRATTITDAKKHGWLPSVTAITGIPAKPLVDKWKIDILLQVVLKYPKHAKYGREDDFFYINSIMAKAKKEWEAARNRGTVIHDKLEKHFTSGDVCKKDANILLPVINFLKDEFKEHQLIPEASFASEHGFGGKVDIHSKEGIILDFKTKAKDELTSKHLYDDYCMQLAAYRLGLQLPGAKCYNLLISMSKPGSFYLHEWSEEDLQKGLKKFLLLLEYWKLQNNFESSWIKEEI